MIRTDKPRVSTLTNCLDNYFRENNTPETSSLTQWEAHKCVIRARPVSMATTIKKERHRYLAGLNNKLKTLEALQKQTLAQKSYQDPHPYGD